MLNRKQWVCIWIFVAICQTAFPAITPEIKNVFSTEAGRHSFLGSVVDSIAANENGFQQNFENGVIFYLDSAFEVHGLILGKYQQLLGPWGYLGFPLSDELTCKDGAGRYSNFKNGSVYYHPTYGTHQVMGAILSQWRLSGADTGALGYPIADPMTCDTGICQQFQHGYVAVKCHAVDMRKHLYALGMRVRNQSWRGTCSVFAMTCLLEYAYAQLLGGEYVDLSEEYMNHVANLASGETDDGSCFAPVASGYASYGVVPESDLPYDVSKAYDFASFNLPESTIAKGRSLLTAPFKLKEILIKPGCPSPSSMGLSSGQLDTIFIELNKGYPVAVGRGHSLVIVGYVLDATMPGGGFFIIRNSYGPDADDQGYRYETIDHLKTTVYDTYAYEMPSGVAFNKLLKGRFVDNHNIGIANSRVTLSATTSQYGIFLRNDSTDSFGFYRIPNILSLISNAIVQMADSLGAVTKQAVFSSDTTVLNFVRGSTNVAPIARYAAQCATFTTVRINRRGSIFLQLSNPLEAKGVIEIFELNGKRVCSEETAQGAGDVTIAYNGSRHAVLLYSLSFLKLGVPKRGIIRLQ